MQITVERFDWSQHQPELVVLVGDPYQNFLGEFEGDLGTKIAGYSEGFASGRLSREVPFSVLDPRSGRLVDYIYFHTSTEKGITATESLKTFLSRALRLACETGRKKVGVCLRGPDGEGLIEALVEGALVGTFKFTDFLKDSTDKFADMELILYPPTPEPLERPAAVAVTQAPVEPAAEAAVEVTQAPVSEAAEVIAEESTDAFAVESAEDPWPAAPVEAEEADAEAQEESAAEETPVEAEPQEPKSEQAQDAADPTAIEVSEPSWSEEERTAWQTKDEAAVRVGGSFGRGVNLARTLIAQPASVCTPEYLAKAGETIAKKYGFGFRSFGVKDLAKHGYVGHLAVGGGSANSPTMFELTVEPSVPSDIHLVLLGKGVTFDSGGISIKPADNMHLMVGDMSGAAAVLGTMDILGQIRPSIKVTAIVVSAENAPDGKSFRPGDILRYKNGLSVHIENTDAEGRLLLADGLIRAGEVGATHVVDIATLTGGCARALGPSFTGVMGANRKLVNAITKAGGNHGESYWRLPLPVEYRSMLKTIHADLNNVGGPNASATTAGLFLQEFVPPRTPWVHLDIAGTFWKSKPWKYYQEGPSGTGVKTLADLALRWHEHMA